MRILPALLVSVATTFLAISAVAAQEPAASEPDSTGRARKAISLKEVHVTAAPVQAGYLVSRSKTGTRTATPLRDTPQAISVVTQSLIADQAMASMADVVRYVPGITMGQGEGHRDAPTIRGNSSTADFFVDGVRDDAQYLRDVYNVERVEVLKGPNAMVFGRGGGGGVVNRVTKQAGAGKTREVVLEGGSWAHRRAALDFSADGAGKAAGRLNAVYENSGSFRDGVRLERSGVNPTVSLSLGARTTVRAGYEYFADGRSVDRGIPSYLGRPAATTSSAFFGNADLSHSSARNHSGQLVVERATKGGVIIRNATRYAFYDKFYQNVFPRDVMTGGSAVALAGYSSATTRSNLFNQLDVVRGVGSGTVWHTLLAGIEVGRQETANFRRTAYFPGGRTLDTVAFAQPATAGAVDFRQSASDADNNVSVATAAVYAQDQVALSARLQAILGVRYERFALAVADHRSASRPSRSDGMLSPRGGLVFKPRDDVSLYTSYSVSQLPSAGDQFSSLTATTQSLEPERFTSYEIGGKWDIGARLAVTAAVYRLDRTNSSAKDPLDPSRIVQTGAQRSNGFELGAVGAPTDRWQLAAGYAAQGARVVSTTSAAIAGATVPLVPRRTLSAWNRYDLSSRIGLGVGLVEQARSYAAIDNAVILPRFRRVDAAIFLTLMPRVRAQVNVENVGNIRYFPTSQGNNNILPGAPRTLRVSLATGF
jgi:catecholate siderophore receptor